MIACLTPAFPGQLERFAGTLSIVDRTTVSFACAALLEPDTICNLIERLALRFPDARHCDLASLWARTYSARLIASVVFPTVLLDRRLPIHIDETRLVIDETSGYPASFQLPNAGTTFETIDPFERFRPLIRGHIEPLIDAIAAHGKAPTKILWGDTAIAFDNLIRRARIAAIERGRVLDYDPITLIEASHWPDGWKNPLHQPFFPPECCDGRRVRKTCCLYYRLKPGNRFCGACPITEKQTKRRAACSTEAA